MKIAKFVNYTDEIFAHPSLGGHDDICQWGREPYCFPPKSSKTMEEWKARFFAKHLTNRELLKIPGGEYHTSPKMKNGEFYSDGDDNIFMEIFNKCFLPMDVEYSSEEKMKDDLMNPKDDKLVEIQDEIKENLHNNAWCDSCDSKGGRHKKGCPKISTVMPKVENEFEGLQK